MDEYGRLPLDQLAAELAGWELTERDKKIAGDLIREIRTRVQFLVDVGLEYLSLARRAPTLSGGESQRIRLASQVGSGLCGVLYVLDEPDDRLCISARKSPLAQAVPLEKLRDLGNTLPLRSNTDREVVKAPINCSTSARAAGEFGGQIVARGTPAQVAKAKGSVTGPYLSGKKAIPVPTSRRMALRETAASNGDVTNPPRPRPSFASQ